jgi:hypothetical protein
MASYADLSVYRHPYLGALRMSIICQGVERRASPSFPCGLDWFIWLSPFVAAGNARKNLLPWAVMSSPTDTPAALAVNDLGAVVLLLFGHLSFGW